MADNLPPEEEEMETDGFYYEEPTTAFEAVNLANFALSTLEMIDPEDEKLTEKGKQAIIKIKKQCLKLLSWGVQEMHDSVFDTE
jgi:hypothetical protein